MRDFPIVLFDALCPLCTATVSFLKKQDQKWLLSFISMHSDEGKQLMEQHGVFLSMNTFAVIKGSSCFIRSDAVLEIARHLGGLWTAMRFFYIIPRPLRDGCYAFLARNRYKWFGKHQSCVKC